MNRRFWSIHFHRESTGSGDLGGRCLVGECQSLIHEELGKFPGFAKIVRDERWQAGDWLEQSRRRNVRPEVQVRRMSKYRVHQAMSAKWPASTGSVGTRPRTRPLEAVRPGNRLALGQLGHWQESQAIGQTGIKKLILAVAVVATTLVSAALMVLASVFFDLGY